MNNLLNKNHKRNYTAWTEVHNDFAITTFSNTRVLWIFRSFSWLWDV